MYTTKPAFRQYLDDLENNQVRSDSYYLTLEAEIINIAYDAGARDVINEKPFDEDYFENTYLE